MKLSIIIAVYNEADTLATLLARVWAQPLPEIAKEIVIVESNSTDGSRELVADFQVRHSQATACRLQVIHEDRPQGKGYAVRTGMTAATGDILLIQDADLEYDTADYPALVQPIMEGRTAFVLGSRCLGAGSRHAATVTVLHPPGAASTSLSVWGAGLATSAATAAAMPATPMTAAGRTADRR